MVIGFHPMCPTSTALEFEVEHDIQERAILSNGRNAFHSAADTLIWVRREDRRRNGGVS